MAAKPRRSAPTSPYAGLGFEYSVVAPSWGPFAGVDEAGRGACCGPLTAAACVLPPRAIPELAGLTDSKKLTARARDRLYDAIIAAADAYAVVSISAAEIDARGIQYANMTAMRQAVAALDTQVGHVLVDAFAIPDLELAQIPIVKGDAVARCISAASVLAKVTRDRLMVELDETYPGYGLGGHKGYGTKAHMDAVRLHGGTPEHRYTYKNVAAAHRQWLDAPRGEAAP